NRGLRLAVDLPTVEVFNSMDRSPTFGRIVAIVQSNPNAPSDFMLQKVMAGAQETPRRPDRGSGRRRSASASLARSLYAGRASRVLDDAAKERVDFPHHLVAAVNAAPRAADAPDKLVARIDRNDERIDHRWLTGAALRRRRLR